MATIYLKDTETLQVSIEDLEKYLYENHERIGIRRKKLRRLPVIYIASNANNCK